MYHSIREGTEARHAYYETTTSPRVFARHMKFLHENGYRAMEWDEIAQSALGSSTPKPAVITFDDGYADFYRQAFPILSEYSFTATVYVITGLLKPERTCFKGTECLTLSEVRELHSRGMTFGSHTVTHPDLRFLKPDEVEHELSCSKKSLEDALGAPVKSFAYPYAFPEADRRFVSSLTDLLSKCGYENGVTTILGTAQPGANRFFLPRLPVNTWDDLTFFQAKLEGAYDWLHGPQYVYKAIRGFLSPRLS
jgi:peptidoglycan/xylan/chitin deacetylase (PgdA/CDA1 family)